MEHFHGLLTLGGALFPLHVQSEALLQVGFGPDTVDALLRLAEAAVGSLDRVAGRGQQFVVQELQRLLQVRTLQLVQALAQLLEPPYPQSQLRQFLQGGRRPTAAVEQSVYLVHDRAQGPQLRQAARHLPQLPPLRRTEVIGISGGTTASSSPTPPSKTGSRRLGEKIQTTLSGAYLDKALADFSGYLAIDEVYDGPFGILSIVDNYRYNRLAFRVLDHDPRQDDVRVFLVEFEEQLAKRQQSVCGITTDGSSLYPKVLEELWPNARHQICEFHVLKEITLAVLHALAKLRKQMTANIPKQPRGRPSKEQQPPARKVKRQKQRVVELFEHRYLFVTHWRCGRASHLRRPDGRPVAGRGRCTDSRVKPGRKYHRRSNSRIGGNDGARK
jgi:hypothetical protein